MPSHRDILPNRRARQRLTPAALTASLLLAGAANAATPGSEAYYERTLMRAADARCHLFTPQVGSALAAAQAQARGAALRGGATNAGLRVLAGQAAGKQAVLACNSKDLAIASARVKTAFDGYSRLIRMTFPGDDIAWQANRTLPTRTTIWRLSQPTAAGPSPIVFGLAGDYAQPARLTAVGDFGEGQAPYAAQLMVRDVSRAPEPYLQAVSRAGWA